MTTRTATRNSEWADIERPGYLGRHRDERYKEWDAMYGPGNWRIVWKLGDETLDFQGACAVYEEAYYQFLKKNQSTLRTLIDDAANVYDDAPSNVFSGVDYTKQETGRTHIQDIAIRNALARLGLQFRGMWLIQIRDKEGTHPLSTVLSPGRVPMHDNGIIQQPELRGWWDKGSVESFYQSNKVLQKRASQIGVEKSQG
jgi:hypothetical protein